MKIKGFFNSIIYTVFLGTSTSFASELTYWITHGTTRVKPSSLPTDNKIATIKAAKNEYEPFQVILQSQENLKDVDVTVSDLVSTNGMRIGKENITLFREHYVYVRVPSYRSDTLPGWYPDVVFLGEKS